LRFTDYWKAALPTRSNISPVSGCIVGVEIHADVAQHCKESIARWKEHNAPARAIHHIDIIHGNALQIAADEGEASLGFDRIYIGAAVDSIVLSRLKKLLKPGGILVGPGK
jgi:protein-L-isoaspartate O-methyltransferase